MPSALAVEIQEELCEGLVRHAVGSFFNVLQGTVRNLQPISPHPNGKRLAGSLHTALLNTLEISCPGKWRQKRLYKASLCLELDVFSEERHDRIGNQVT
jgi:hypothetical protein